MGDALEDLAEHEVVRVRVGRLAARPVLEWKLRHRRDQPARRNHRSWVAGHGADPGLVLHVLRDPARVVQQLPDPDLPTCAKPTWEIAVDCVVEPDPVLSDELHHDRRDEGLRHASDPESISRPRLPAAELGVPRRHDDASAIALDEGDHGGNGRCGDEPVGGPLQLCFGRGCRSGEDCACESEGCERPHVTYTRRDGRP